MNIYTVIAYTKYRRPLAVVTVKAESKPEAIAKAKEQGAFSQGTRGYMVKKIKEESLNEQDLTLEFCAKEIVKSGSIRIGASVLCHCYDGTVSVVDWNGKTVWFPRLSIEAIQHFIDIQPK